MQIRRPKSGIRRHINVVHLLVMFCIATLALHYLNRAHAQDSVDRQLLDIQNTQSTDSYETLLVGDTETAIIVRQSTTPITRGVAVLYNDYGSNPFSQHGLGLLANYLNDLGWLTMTVQAPEEGLSAKLSADMQTPTMQPNAPNQSISHSRQGISTISAQAFAQQESMLIQQMQALRTKASDYRGFFLVVAQGSTAAWLTKLFAEKQLDLPDALVSVSPYWPEYQYNQSLPGWVARTEMPYLDIYTNSDNDWAASTVAKRKIQARKSLKLLYRQRQLIGQSANSIQHPLLAKEIHGWLTYMGW